MRRGDPSQEPAQFSIGIGTKDKRRRHARQDANDLASRRNRNDTANRSCSKGDPEITLSLAALKELAAWLLATTSTQGGSRCQSLTGESPPAPSGQRGNSEVGGTLAASAGEREANGTAIAGKNDRSSQRSERNARRRGDA